MLLIPNVRSRKLLWTIMNGEYPDFNIPRSCPELHVQHTANFLVNWDKYEL